jgi:hypothetical protein
MLTVKELLKKEDFFDSTILRHGFTDYMRDYEIIVAARNGPPNTDVHNYQFVGCVEAHYQTKLRESFTQSLSDEHVYSGPDFPDKKEPAGFIWGMRFAEAYPGLKYIENGERAEHWSRLLGQKMHEVLLETNCFRLQLVFADVRYAFLGHEPQVVLPKNMPLEIKKNFRWWCLLILRHISFAHFPRLPARKFSVTESACLTQACCS